MGPIRASEEARPTSSGETPGSARAPWIGEQLIGITCHLCARELRADDDLSAQDNQLVHLSCMNQLNKEPRG